LVIVIANWSTLSVVVLSIINCLLLLSLSLL
jgi:hypothetical protein